MKSSPARFFDIWLPVACALFVFCAPASGVSIDWVTVGNAGNAGELTGTAAGSDWPTATVGAVDYEYRIGKYEVTNAQYAEFLNGVDPTGTNGLELYSQSMSDFAVGGINFNSGATDGFKYELKANQANNPVAFVDWYDAIRFTNWVQNGGGNANTEDGSYTLVGGTPVPSNAATITKNPGADIFLPTESEWYKAAYHKNDGVTGNYWDYATRTDVAPYSDNPLSIDTPDPTNTGNIYADDNIYGNGYNDGWALTGSQLPTDINANALTDVGAYVDAIGPYGTYDQGDNVQEWNENFIIDSEGIHPGRNGGSWSVGAQAVNATVRFGGFADEDADTYDNVGFRLVNYAAGPGPGDGGGSGQIPEPSTLLSSALGTLALVRRRRKLRHLTA
jgi:formylglycine-generating enzyme required for sulfatase activity